MTVAKKQFEVAMNFRLLATDTSGIVSQANTTVALDDFVINGVAWKPADLDATKLATLEAAILAVVADEKSIPAS